jgi:hypothetical protein
MTHGGEVVVDIANAPADDQVWYASPSLQFLAETR